MAACDRIVGGPGSDGREYSESRRRCGLTLGLPDALRAFDRLCAHVAAQADNVSFERPRYRTRSWPCSWSSGKHLPDASRVLHTRHHELS